MGQFISWCSSHFFADNLAAIVSGQTGKGFTDQCLDLEKQLKLFLNQLEYYLSLSVQPINFSKTEALFSARVIGLPKFDTFFDLTKAKKIKWVEEFKYLGCWITPKIGWGFMIKKMKTKARQRISLIRSFKLFGCSSRQLRYALFASYALPLFTWIYPIFPLFSDNQRNDLSHIHFTCLRRVMFSPHWNENFFAYAMDEKSSEERCSLYWEKYLVALADSIDGGLILEKANLNEFRKAWLHGEFSLQGLRRSKIFIECTSILEKALSWLRSVPFSSSLPYFEMEEVQLLQAFPENF